MNDRRIISLRRVLAVVACSICASFLLVPNQDQLRERLFEDRISSDIRKLIQEGVFGEKELAQARFAKLSAEQLAFISQIHRLTPRECLNLIFNSTRKVTYDPFVHYFVIAAVQYVDVIEPGEAFEMIMPKASQIPETLRLQLFRLLARNALALNSPATAVRILQAASVIQGSDWETINSLVSAERWLNQPGAARRALKDWMVRSLDRLDANVHAKAKALLFTLALEAGVPEEALATCLEELRSLPAGGDIPIGLLEQTLKAGQYAGATREVLPWIERYLHRFREDHLAWATLLARCQKGEPVDPDYLRWSARAAQVADWNALAERACYHHLRLVVMGQPSSLDRYLPLSTYLGHGQETAALLTALGPIPGREDLQLTLARLTASNRGAEEALKLYELWVDKHPKDQLARWELACLMEAVSSPAEAIATFRQHLADFPGDARAIKRTINLLNRNGLHLEALQRLDALPKADFDPDTIEDYILLAESMDSAGSLMRALRIKIETATAPNVLDFIGIADVARSVDSVESAMVVLREAIQRLPEVSMLRTQMAAMLLQEELFDEAVTTAMHPAAWGDEEAKLIALAACLRTGRAGEVLEALGEDFASKRKLAFNTLLDLAVAYRQVGRQQHADGLFALVPEIPERYPRIAQAYMLAQDHSNAVRLAQLNLQSKPIPEASDWILFGDILYKQGRTDEAQVAYARAIRSVTAKIPKSTAAIQLPYPSDQ